MPEYRRSPVVQMLLQAVEQMIAQGRPRISTGVNPAEPTLEFFELNGDIDPKPVLTIEIISGKIGEELHLRVTGEDTFVAGFKAQKDSWPSTPFVFVD